MTDDLGVMAGWPVKSGATQMVIESTRIYGSPSVASQVCTHYITSNYSWHLPLPELQSDPG